MATTNVNTVDIQESEPAQAYENVSTTSGVFGLTSEVVRNVTEEVEFTKFTDSSLLVSDNASLVQTQIDDVEDTASIVSFLQRPCQLYYATLNANSITPISSFASLTGPADQPSIISFTVPNATLQFGNRIQKITNFEWFKADTVFRILTNVNPFVAGKLWACYAPYDDILELQTRIIRKGRAAITSYPGVEVDLQSTNAAVIRIPWSGASDAFSLTSNQVPTGRFYLFALTPIMAIGNPKIPIQIFSHFENISLTGPTPLPVILQGVATEAKGPIQEISGKVKNFANKFQNVLSPIPIVGDIAKAVPWVAGALEGVASIFGWSRPVSGSGVMPIGNLPGRGYGQVKVEDSSTMLAFSNDNMIATDNGNFLESVDEMSVNHISGRPALISSTQWGVDSVPLAFIAAQQVGPYPNSSRSTSWLIGTQRYEVYDLSLFEELGTLFGLWKADLHYRINVVRTPFHVGRFEVFFIPRATLADPIDVPSLDTTNLYRHIVDITETNDLEFVVPYMHQNTMCSRGNVVLPTTSTQSPGLLVIRALSPLNCPETVSQFVMVNVWSWATNVSFACPITLGTQVPPNPPIRARLQGVVRNEEMNANTIVFGKTNSEQNILQTTTTVAGEVALNMRALTRAHRPFSSAITNNYLLNTNIIGGWGGYLGHMANIFAFYRGGISIKLLSEVGIPTSVESYIRTFLTRTIGNTPVPGSNVEHLTFPEINPFHEIQVPFYSNTRRGICNNSLASASAETATSLQPGVLVNTNLDNLFAFIGAKDDLTFGYLIGPPIYSVPVASLPQKINKREEVTSLPDIVQFPRIVNGEVIKVDLQGVEEDFSKPPSSAYEEGAIYYYGSTTAMRKQILAHGFRSLKGRLVVFKDRNSISKSKTVIYSVKILPGQIVRDLIDRIVVSDITEMHEVEIYGHVYEFWKHVKMQSYNPLNLISNANQALSGISALASSMNDTLGSVQSVLSNWKLTVLGTEVQGLFLKMSKVLVNAFMAQPSLLLYNIIVNVMLEFGTDIYNKILGSFGIGVQLQSMANLLNPEVFKKYIGENCRVSAVVLTSVISLIFLASFGIPLTGGIDRIIKITGDRARSLKNIVDFSNATSSIFTEVGNNIMYYTFGTTMAPELDQYVSGYKEWCDSVLCLNNVEEPLAQRLEKDEKLVVQVDALYRRGIFYSSIVNNIKAGPNVTLHYQRIFKIIEEARRLCDYTGVFGNKPRVKPAVIQLFGESGVGKSGMTWPLAGDLNMLFCSTVEEAADYSHEIYARNTEQEFWDGYAGQNIVVYDDFGQRVDTPAAPNEEFMELIRAANIAPYPLHMAELSEKKRTKFCSKVIILTSNVLQQNVSSLTFPDAYRRRIDICGRVINKPEYTRSGWSNTTRQVVERLDTSKCASAVDTDPYLVELYDPESMQPLIVGGNPVVLDYEQFLEHSCKIVKYNLSQSRDFNQQLGRRINEERFQRITASLQGYVPSMFLEIRDELTDFVKKTYAEYASLTGLLVLLGILLAGLGIFAYMRRDKRRGRNAVRFEATSGDVVTRKVVPVVNEATSGDFITPKNVRISPRVAVEATSGDFLTPKRSCVLESSMYGILEATSGDSVTRRIQHVHMESSADVELQAWRDVGAQELITNRILNNLYMISVKRGDDFVRVLQCLFVRDSVALCPNHLLLSVKDTDTIRIRNINGVEFELPFSAIKRQRIRSPSGYEKDAMLLQFPRNYVGSHCDILKHFQTMPELAARRAMVCVPTLRQYARNSCLTILGNSDARMSSVTFDAGLGEPIQIRDCVRYCLNTINGDCGAPIICNENSFQRKIAGIHIAASVDGSEAFGQSVTRADLELALDSIHDLVVNDVDELPNFKPLVVELQLNKEYSEEEYLEMSGTLSPAIHKFGECTRNIYVPNKTEIRESCLNGKILPPITKPSKLWSKDENILIKNFKKNAINTPYIPKVEVDRAVSEVETLLLTNRSPRLARILTYEEAIRGCDDSEYIKSIERSSSAGYPWVLDREPGKPGKTTWFGSNENFIFNDEVRQAVEARIARAKLGIRTPTVWCATLKDERRPIEKVDAGKTRVFSNGPQDFTIAYRMYFLGFQAHIMENRILNEQSLGTNVYGYDWTRTAQYLQRRGKNVFAGDFSSFDGTLNTNIMYAFVDVVNKFYNDGPENALIRRVLFMEVYNSTQLCDGKYVGLTHSQPSGNPGTTVLNSFYNSVSMRIAFYRSVKDKNFGDHISMVSYGDDNVVNISDAITPEFNQLIATDAYASFGMIYTDEAKTGNIVPFRSISEVAYLKRNFRKVGPIYRAPAPLEVILETPNWYRKCTDALGATLDNVVGSCEELAQHPEEVFNKYSQLLIDTTYQETNEYPLVYNYATYNDRWNQEMGFLE